MQETLGPLPRLCTGTRVELKHQMESEIEGPRDLKNQHEAQRDQDQAKGAIYWQEKGLACQASEPDKGQGHR